jgi:hypothetical protein
VGDNPHIDEDLYPYLIQTMLDNPKVMIFGGYSLYRANFVVESLVLISTGITRYRLLAIGAVPGCSSILNSIAFSGGIHGRSSGNSQTT